MKKVLVVIAVLAMVMCAGAVKSQEVSTYTIIGGNSVSAANPSMMCRATLYGYYCKIGEYQVKYEYTNGAKTAGRLSTAGPSALVQQDRGGVFVEYGHYVLSP